VKVYDAVFDGKKGSGVYALSCVEDPAMEDVWITLKDHPKEIQFAAVDQEKRLLLGAALIPNKKIYRKMDGEEFYVKFSEDTIEQVAHAFIENGNQNMSFENHDQPIEGVSVVETWIVEDPVKDKSSHYGKEYEKGTWVAMMKVHNDDTWAKAKEGKLKGFSIDALLGLKEISFKNQIMSDKKNIVEAIKEAFAEMKFGQKEVQMGRLKLKDNKTIVEFEGDKPEVGMPVFALSEDKQEKVAMPEGAHELENGEILHVDKNGLVADAQVEEPADIKEAVTEMAKAFKVEMQKMQDAFDAKLKKAIEDVQGAHKKEVDALEAKLAAEPAAPKVVKTELVKEPKTKEDRLFNAILSAQSN
jgi:hypothetical protein